MTALTEATATTPAPTPAGRRRRPLLVGELVVVLLLVHAYDSVRQAVGVHRLAAVVHGEQVLSLERVLRLDVEGWAARLLPSGSLPTWPWSATTSSCTWA